MGAGVGEGVEVGMGVGVRDGAGEDVSGVAVAVSGRFTTGVWGVLSSAVGVGEEEQALIDMSRSTNPNT